MLILKIMLKETKGSKTLNRQIKQVKIIIKDNVRENKLMKNFQIFCGSSLTQR
jgi:hypothetical protein